jgi:hypothetical protein
MEFAYLKPSGDDRYRQCLLDSYAIYLRFGLHRPSMKDHRMRTTRRLVLAGMAAISFPAVSRAECFVDEPRLVAMQPGSYGNVNLLYRAEVDAEDAAVTLSGTAQVWFYYVGMGGGLDQGMTTVPVMARARRGAVTVDMLLNVVSVGGSIVKIEDVDFDGVTCG